MFLPGAFEAHQVKEMNRPAVSTRPAIRGATRKLVAFHLVSDSDFEDLLRQQSDAADERDRFADIREAAADERERRADAYESSLDEQAAFLSRRAAGPGSSVRDVIDAGRATIARVRARIDRAEVALDRSAERLSRDTLSARKQQALIDAEKRISAQLLETYVASDPVPQDSRDPAD